MFAKFKQKSPLVEKLLPVALNADYAKGLYTVSGGGGLLYQALASDPVFGEICKGWKVVPTFLKFEPYQFTNWHVDLNRACAINLVLAGKGQTLFTEGLTTVPILDIVVLEYEERYPYLIDTSVQHAVVTLDQPRYVLSLGFYYGIGDFVEVMKWAKERGII